MTATDTANRTDQLERGATAPRIWLVIGDKPGDNAQVLMIAERLGMPYEIRRVLPKPEYILGKPRYQVSLGHVDLERSDRLEPPWPDLIITIGRRQSMAALWIQEQSGYRSRIVLLGRPKRWTERFSLIIAPSQYHMPHDPRVLQLELPLMRSNEDRIAQAAGEWRERLAPLPRPLTALFVGGPTKPFRFDERAAADMLEKAVAATGSGHLYISTSRRTPPSVVASMRERLPANATLFRWEPDATDNPYFALLGLADQLIVTGDSVSMMVEVARLGRPLAIYPLPQNGNILPRLRRWAGRIPQQSGVIAGILEQLGLLRYGRDLTEIHQSLYNRRLAVPLGQPMIHEGRTPPDELQLAVERVEKVLYQ